MADCCGCLSGMTTFSNSITITNNSIDPIEVVTVADYSIAETDRKRIHKIESRESVVFFMDCIASLKWKKP